MAHRVVWPIYAILDLEEIVTGIAADSPAAAKATAKRIVSATRLLVQFPYSGRTVPQFQPSTVRQIFVEEYRVVYEIVDEEMIEIWMVAHTRRKFPPRKILDRKIFP
ncbi:MAG TPA: type II toxin-antitoxin system RelE/ParE family toxin [Longimicrobium sp.]|nr:type II toxin-antitoxin system RelE/ParE family toxin [Longimicrobium sp.]